MKQNFLKFEASKSNDIIQRFKEDDEMIVKCDEDAIRRKSFLGRIFRIQIADGYAFYQIIGETKTKFKVMHIATGDAWADHYFGCGGSFPKKHIENIIKREDAFRKLFSKR